VKLPRDLSGVQLAKHLGRVGYKVTRQTGSHIRLTVEEPVQHHITIPAHDALKIGTLSAVLGEVATHLKLTRDELLGRLFD
jgi:predicted RNA binding protein YcfA (HicA-like mRNA interferase family)